MTKYQMPFYKMNSEYIRSIESQAYKDVFVRCPVVCSTPMQFFWAGDYSSFTGGLAVTQKIPTRVFVGLEPTAKSQIRFVTYKEFSPSKKTYMEYEYGAQLEQRLCSIVKKFIASSGKTEGFDIHILMENTPWCGLNISGATGAALASALFIALGLADSKEIEKFGTQTIAELQQNPVFEGIFKLAWKIEASLNIGFSGGAGAFSSLVRSAYPLGFRFLTKNNMAYIENILKGNYDFVDQLKWWASRMDDLEEISSAHPSFPVDFGLVWTGQESEPESSFKSVIKEHTSFKEIQAFQRKIQYEPLWKTTLWDENINTLNILSILIFKSLQEMFEKGLSEEASREFLETLENYDSALNIFDINSEDSNVVYRTIKNVSKEMDLPVAIKSIGWGFGGDLLFVSPRFRITNALVPEFEKLSNIKPIVDYLSWRDGQEENGVTLEQNLEEKIYSPFISSGSVLLKSLDNKGALDSEVMTMEEFEAEKPKIDFLIDLPNEDLYIRGEIMTSKAIPSASYAVEIFKVILLKPNLTIANIDLPRSSYSADRGEMQSKIVSPLEKVFKNRLKKNLPLQLSGGLDKFTLKLLPSEVKIVSLERIF